MPVLFLKNQPYLIMKGEITHRDKKYNTGIFWDCLSSEDSHKSQLENCSFWEFHNSFILQPIENGYDKEKVKEAWIIISFKVTQTLILGCDPN